MTRYERLFRPRSIAVIGGGAWCANVIEQCQKLGFQGEVYPVHPSKSEIRGVKAYPSLDALPEVPDAAFIGVNRVATIEVVKALAENGAGGAVCFASGFREATREMADGDDLQEALVAAAGEMPILGPNCYGLLNLLDGAALWPDQHGAVPCERGVAIVTQSSNMAINLTMQTRGLPIAYVVTAGNQAQMGLADIGAALLEDPRVTALGLHIEGIGDLAAFEQLANKARALGKPIVALKIGASDQARAATLSHTASLAGSDAGARALLARLGVAQVGGLGAFLETLKIFHVNGPLASAQIGSMSCSGGEASLMADLGLKYDVGYPPLSEEQTEALRKALGPKVALSNPLDYHTYIWADREAMTACFSAMMTSDLAIGCVVLDFPRADRCDGAAWMLVIDAVEAASAESGRPIAILSSLADTMPEEIAVVCTERGVLTLSGLEDGLAAIAAAAAVGAAWARPVAAPLLLPVPSGGGSEMLSEAEAKQRLAAYGVAIPEQVRALTAEAVADAARALGGIVAVKGEGVAHKSEAGAVAVGLTSAEAAYAAAEKMGAESFLVEQMVIGAVAELLIGVVRDPAHGFVLTLGAGGTLTEILKDTTSRLLPVAEDDLREMLGELKIAPILAGYRGGVAADTKAIVDAVMAVQAYVQANAAEMEEVEINPLICLPNGAMAVDALIRIGVNDE
jgi:acyl-CoA synthetase (NDP forming)